MSQSFLFVNWVFVVLMLFHFNSQHCIWHVRLLNIYKPVRNLTCIHCLICSPIWREISGLPSVLSTSIHTPVSTSRHDRIIQIILLQQIVETSNFRMVKRSIRDCSSSDVLLLGSSNDNSMSLRRFCTESLTLSFQFISSYNVSLSCA